jgi:hypothetical protein
MGPRPHEPNLPIIIPREAPQAPRLQKKRPLDKLFHSRIHMNL